MTDREEMDSPPIIPKTSNDLNKKQTSEILANHPLTKNMNNLSSLIKSKDSHHHHHHHNSSANKNLSQTASNMTHEELFEKYNSFFQLSFEDFEIILNQLRSLKLFIIKLLIYLHKNTFITNIQCINVLTNILSNIHDYEKQLSLFKSELSAIIANIIWACLTNEQDNTTNISKKNTSVLLSLNDVCDLLKDGQHHPLFLLLLQQLQQLFNNDENYM
jgi:hypothetical protein